MYPDGRDRHEFPEFVCVEEEETISLIKRVYDIGARFSEPIVAVVVYAV